MKNIGVRTLSEIMAQPQAWDSAIQILLAQARELTDFYQQGNYDTVLFTGCGSTHYLSLSAAAKLQELAGVPARGLPASEVWLNPLSAWLPSQRTLLVAVSRSGETTETIRACEAFRSDGNGEVLSVTCYPGSSIAGMATASIILPSSQEESVAQTRSFSSLFLATVVLSALWSGRNDLVHRLRGLPDVCARILDKYRDVAREFSVGEDRDRFYFLGSGSRYGLACELSLKMKEMSLTDSEPFHFMEFRHGPVSMVAQGTQIVGLVSDANRAHEMEVIKSLQGLGGHSLTLGEVGTETAFSSDLWEPLRDVLYLPVGQLMAFERSLWKGLDPDLPRNLTPVVRLEV